MRACLPTMRARGRALGTGIPGTSKAATRRHSNKIAPTVRRENTGPRSFLSTSSQTYSSSSTIYGSSLAMACLDVLLDKTRPSSQKTQHSHEPSVGLGACSQTDEDAARCSTVLARCAQRQTCFACGRQNRGRPEAARPGQHRWPDRLLHVAYSRPCASLAALATMAPLALGRAACAGCRWCAFDALR